MIKLLNSSRINYKQVLALFASNILLIIIGFGVKKIQTGELGDINYGEYAFFITLVSFISLFFRFGFFVSIQNLLAQNYNPIREKKLLAVGFIIAAINGLGLGLIIWFISFFVNDLFNTNIGNILQVLAPLTIIYPFQYFFSAYGIGTNKIKINVWFNILPKLMFLLLLLFWLFQIQYSLNVFYVVLLNLLSTLFIIIFYFLRLKPDFTNLYTYWQLLFLKTKKYGFQYYKGAITNQTTYKLDGLLLAAFHTTTLLGFYSLALLITSPMLTMSQSINQSMFKKYSHLKKIPKQIFLYNTIWLLGSILFFYLFGNFIVQFLFGFDFIVVSKYAFYLTFVLFFHGLATPFSFLAAKSMGKEIRNVAFLEAIFNIILNILLIPFYGVIGAIIASFFAKLANFAYSFHYYKKYLKNN